jgi:peptidoglycan/xylan/chitin deacetylase (PgdA/CDA1 family)
MSPAPRPFRVVVLTGWDHPSTILAARRVLERPGIELAGVVQDRGVFTLKTRLKRFWRRGRREGLGYIGWRLAVASMDRGRRVLLRPFDPRPIRRAIFPDEPGSLADLCVRRGATHVIVDSLNSVEAQRQLTALEADLGLVIGTRILKRQTFAVPRLGSINVHKGKVPEYRGQPPAFWELYNGEKAAGVTIHLVDDTLDTGDIVTEGAVPIGPGETEHSLKVKLDDLAASLLGDAVDLIARGRATPRRQPPSTTPAYTTPTRAQRSVLDRRLGTASEPAFKRALKAAVYRACVTIGPVVIRNAWLRLRRRSRYTVLLYHRVNDVSKDNLTTSVDRFIEHLSALKRHYPVISLSVALDASRGGPYLGPNVVVITFDDGYADNHEIAAPTLDYFGLPATFFVSAGLVDTDTRFAHDVKSPHRFSNLTWRQVTDLAARGFEIGSHGWSHKNLARYPLEEARREILRSRDALTQRLGIPPRSFAYPHGGREDISLEVLREIRAAGFQVVASAYGGVNHGSVLPDNVLRVGVSNAFDAWGLRAAVEGITLQAMRLSLARWWDRPHPTGRLPRPEPKLAEQRERRRSA